MTNSILLSIIIPLYNVEKYIEKCLRSIINQDISQEVYEIIIINDGSTDKSYEIAQRIIRNYPNIFLFNQENAGVSAARNKGIIHAKGRYCMFLDSDDFLSSNALKFLIESPSFTNEIDLVQYGMKKIKEGQTEEKISSFPELSVFSSKEEYLNTCFFPNRVWQAEASRFLFKTSLIKENDIFFHKDICMGEDQLFTLCNIRYAKKIALAPWNIYNYFIREDSATNNFSYKSAESMLKTAYEIKKLLPEISKENNETEIFLYKRFINIFVTQYVDRILNDNHIKRPLTLIKADIKKYNLEKLYYIPRYPGEKSTIRIFNSNISLYVKRILVKKFIIKLLK
ncbi:MAG: glycosyltransferase [Candidatus Azobacteroides sp.]|nr:glycosyltransferase [Candidatus Azobacteroides sp.]